MRSLAFTLRNSLIFTILFVFSMCGCDADSAQRVAGACPNKLGSPIQNFCVVTPNVLWRGARPDKDDASWLIQQGVRTIVNLELILDDKRAFGQAAIAEMKNCEVGYFRIHDWEPLPLLAPALEDDNVAHFLAIVSRQPKPVYVHCRSGMNRAGVMIAAYRVLVEGVSVEAAIEEMKIYRGLWFEANARYIRGVSPLRREEIRRMVITWAPRLKMNAKFICTKGICTVSDQ
ncbi:MAG: protein tyrosine phosphatase family protein [Syntrophales bacterium]